MKFSESLEESIQAIGSTSGSRSSSQALGSLGTSCQSSLLAYALEDASATCVWAQGVGAQAWEPDAQR